MRFNRLQMYYISAASWGLGILTGGVVGYGYGGEPKLIAAAVGAIMMVTLANNALAIILPETFQLISRSGDINSDYTLYGNPARHPNRLMPLSSVFLSTGLFLFVGDVLMPARFWGIICIINVVVGLVACCRVIGAVIYDRFES